MRRRRSSFSVPPHLLLLLLHRVLFHLLNKYPTYLYLGESFNLQFLQVNFHPPFPPLQDPLQSRTCLLAYPIIHCCSINNIIIIVLLPQVAEQPFLGGRVTKTCDLHFLGLIRAPLSSQGVVKVSSSHVYLINDQWKVRRMSSSNYTLGKRVNGGTEVKCL